MSTLEIGDIFMIANADDESIWPRICRHVFKYYGYGPFRVTTMCNCKNVHGDGLFHAATMDGRPIIVIPRGENRGEPFHFNHLRVTISSFATAVSKTTKKRKIT